MKPQKSSNPVAKFSKRFNKAVVHKPKRGRGSYSRQYNIDEDFYELYERNDERDT